MGKAFNMLTKQVNGRHSSRTRYVPFPTRVAELEKATLELYAYICREIANDSESPTDQGLVAAYAEFKKHLEGTIV